MTPSGERVDDDDDISTSEEVSGDVHGGDGDRDGSVGTTICPVQEKGKGKRKREDEDVDGGDEDGEDEDEEEDDYFDYADYDEPHYSYKTNLEREEWGSGKRLKHYIIGECHISWVRVETSLSDCGGMGATRREGQEEGGEDGRPWGAQDARIHA